MQNSSGRLATALALVLVLGAPARGGDGDAVALVNGTPITKDQLYKVMLDVRGVEVLQHLVLVELARQTAAQAGVKATPGDIEAEYQESLTKIALEAGLGPGATAGEKKQALDALLEQKRITEAEFRLSMERNALLRKVIEKNPVEISEATLRAEYARTHGEKRIIRHIQVPANDAALLTQALSQLQAGVEFGEVARRLSVNREDPERGGEMRPFAFDDEEIPAVLREAAFAMKEGDVLTQPIRTEQFLHLLKLERIIAPDNSTFEDVKQDMKAKMREKATMVTMSKLTAELYKKAKISVLDDRLKRRYDEFRRQSEAAGR